ncbi:MAG TPA: hypothetical protein VH540_06225 [Ktedonobacterales bacterium]|jgi:hypothetical protein
MNYTSQDQPPCEEPLAPGTHVFDVNGAKVGQVRLSALSKGYFIVEQGWLVSHELFLPATSISRRDTRGVSLNLSKQELRQQRWRVPPDEWLVGEPMHSPAPTSAEGEPPLSTD